jgi:signal transduction histidine kinase
VTTLSDSINNLLNNVQRFSKTNFELYLQPEAEEGMQEEQKRMVYRVVQEQLTNILKYAEASTVRVAVQLRHKEVCVTVTDNGKGFDPLAVKTGIGLKNMQDRLQAVGGRLTVVSALQKGCEIQALFAV